MSKGEQRRPELDGVRGIAILLVLIGHSDYRLAPLAATGVALFFVLSGFLITGMLRDEHERSGQIDLRWFYTRRFTRLAPPLFMMLLVMGLLIPTGWEQILPPMLWVTNYAAHIGLDVEPFGHTWSLAVEEQFYLVWPVVFLALTRLRSRAAPYVLFGITLTLLGWRIVLTANGFLDYAYSALETAAVPMLGGCLIALTSWRLPTNRAPVALAATGALSVGAAVRDPDLWLITPVLVLPSAAVLVASCENAQWLAWRPLALCGVASYSIYLWHKPVAWALEGGLTPLGVGTGALVGLLAFVVVERPLMRWRRRQTCRAETAAARVLTQPALQ
jgi:peptidoglycan/LPS O-acetylase OafA/YrhL